MSTMKKNNQKILGSAISLIVINCLFLITKPAYADENGTGFWLTGQYASGAALPPSPGFGVTTLFYNYKGNQSSVVPNSAMSINSNISATTTAYLFQPSYTFETKILGATPHLALDLVQAMPLLEPHIQQQLNNFFQATKPLVEQPIYIQ